jgi:hypothetical protein
MGSFVLSKQTACAGVRYRRQSGTFFRNYMEQRSA